MAVRSFKVRGPRTGFPLDMLRYDSCWPTGQHDVDVIAASLNPESRQDLLMIITVGLSTFDRNFSSPTIARWESFGWRVLDE